MPRRRIPSRLPVAGILLFLGVLYAFFAGLRTVGDPDLGWQIATGRWIVQHHQIPSVDVLSHTAAGQPWIYPVLSQIVLYGLHAIGGFSLLSWLGALACAATVLLIARKSRVVAAVALLAVPLVASRMTPRAELFTEVLFAAFVVLLWNFHRTARAPLWLLPLLMLLWVNLHLGFIAGLAMCAAYIALELADGRLTGSGNESMARLRKAAPYLAATFVATLVNPWGAGIHAAIYRQSQIMKLHSDWIAEWRSVRATPARILTDAFGWAYAESALWWILAITVVAVAAAIYRRRPVAAAMLAVAAGLALQSTRLRGPFAVLAVVIGGSVIAEALGTDRLRCAWQRVSARLPSGAAAVLITCALAALVAVRIFTLTTNDDYYRHPDRMAPFGVGTSAWYPEQAAEFLVREKPPGNLFNDFTVGGFLAGKVSPEPYRDYIDGRAVPFSHEQFFKAMRLLGVSLDSEEWRKEASERGINTIFVSLDRNLWAGLTSLNAWCQSSEWRPIYIDAYTAIFLRKTAETSAWLQRLEQNCQTLPLAGAPAETLARPERFSYHLNAAAVLFSLGRYDEASQRLNSAEAISSNNAYLQFLKGVLVGFSGDIPAAEACLRRSLDIQPSSDAAYALTKLLQNVGRRQEAEQVLRQQIELVDNPALLYMELGRMQVETTNPKEALNSFDQAERWSSYGQALGGPFYARLHAGRALALERSGDRRGALESLRRAVSVDPTDVELQQRLAELSKDAGEQSRPPSGTSGAERK